MEFIDLRHCCLNDQCAAIMARSFKLNTTLRILHLEGDNLSGKLLLILCKWQFLSGEGVHLTAYINFSIYVYMKFALDA